jgi:glycine/D-amino acid oxidase-like deaminating enzyme
MAAKVLDSYPVRTSFWGEAEPEDQLVGVQTADVTIVGAGIAGMSSAYFLKQADPSLNVALLEQGYVGYGASGRNFGNVPQLARQAIDNIVSSLGEDEARALINHEARMLNEYDTLLRRERIVCEFERVNCLMLAHRQEAFDELVRLHELHQRFGFPSEVFDAQQTRAFVNTPNAGSLSCGRNGYQQPFMFCRGFREALVRLGVKLHEGTRVVGFDESSDGVVLKTETGEISARQVVFATNAYTPQLGLAQGDIRVGYTYVLATEPLVLEQREELSWSRRHRVILDKEPMETYYYMQLRPDGRLLFGGAAARAESSAMPPHDNQSAYQRLHAEMQKRFPFLSRIGIEAAWGGPLDFTLSGSPIIRRMSNRSVINVGYSGRGALIGSLSGKVVAGLVLGSEHGDPDYVAYADRLSKLHAPRH